MVERRCNPDDGGLPAGDLVRVDVLDEVADASEELCLPQDVAAEPGEQLAIAELARIVWVVKRHVANVVEPGSCRDAVDGLIAQTKLARQRDRIDRRPFSVPQ